jgi:hypothetical protein
MTIVETTVKLSIPPEGLNMEELEGQIAELLQQAGKELTRKGCEQMDKQLLEANPDLRRVKRRGLQFLSRFGWMKLVRWQTRDQEGRYRYPLNTRLGLEPRQRVSPWLVGQGIALATRIPYRQAADLLGTFMGEWIDHRTLYRWVEDAGEAIIEEEDQLQKAVFQEGRVLPEPGEQRELILAEVDATFLRAQREESDRFEVRLGILASGKEVQSYRARYRRYRLLGRISYVGVETAQDFGERLFLAGEEELGLSRADDILLVGDGAEWIEALAGHERWRATYQLDWWHLIQALHRTFPSHSVLVRTLKRYLYEGEGDQLIDAVRLAKLNGLGDPEAVEKLLNYLETNRDGFYGARSLRERISEKAKRLCVEGSGAVEKHIDIVICRRFKGQGMRWTRRGANRLLKLRVRELDRARARRKQAA